MCNRMEYIRSRAEDKETVFQLLTSLFCLFGSLCWTREEIASAMIKLMTCSREDWGGTCWELQQLLHTSGATGYWNYCKSELVIITPSSKTHIILQLHSENEFVVVVNFGCKGSVVRAQKVQRAFEKEMVQPVLSFVGGTV